MLNINKYFGCFILVLIAASVPVLSQDTYCPTMERVLNCPLDYDPVCAFEFGCVDYSCAKTMPNGCTACADPKVSSHVPGECPGASQDDTGAEGEREAEIEAEAEVQVEAETETGAGEGEIGGEEEGEAEEEWQTEGEVGEGDEAGDEGWQPEEGWFGEEEWQTEEGGFGEGEIEEGEIGIDIQVVIGGLEVETEPEETGEGEGEVEEEWVITEGEIEFEIDVLIEIDGLTPEGDRILLETWWEV